MTRSICPVGKASPRFSRVAAILGAVTVLASVIVPVPLHAAPVYTLLFKANYPDYVEVTGPTPVQQTYSWTNGVTNFESIGFAMEGKVGMIERVTTSCDGVTDAEEARASATSDDFLITGPPGPTTVTGTMHFWADVHASVSGGELTNSTRALGWISFVYYDPNAPVEANGDYYVGNQNYAGTGFMSSFVPPGGVFPTSFTTDFPVGTPFNVILSMSSSGWTYTHVGNCPASVEANLSGFIGDAGGHVIDLPDGYYLNSAEWGIVNNEIPPTAVEKTTWGAIKALYH